MSELFKGAVSDTARAQAEAEYSWVPALARESIALGLTLLEEIDAHHRKVLDPKHATATQLLATWRRAPSPDESAGIYEDWQRHRLLVVTAIARLVAGYVKPIVITRAEASKMGVIIPPPA